MRFLLHNIPNTINNYMKLSLLESVVDQTLKTYSPYVFDNPEDTAPTIKEYLKNKIEQDIDKVRSVVPIVDYFIKGSILSKQYTKDSDIDIFIRVKSTKSEKDLRDILYSTWLEIDDKYLKGIPHPLQYYITNKGYNIKNAEGIYNLKDDEWIKRTPSKNINIDDYSKDFEKYVQQFSDFTEEIRRDMVDIEILKDIPQNQLDGLSKKIQRKLNKLEKSLLSLIDVYGELSVFRNDAFAEDMTPSELKKYGIKTRLPGNVVFKLIERYHYIDLAKKIKKILGRDEELSGKEYKQLNQLLKTNLTKGATMTRFKGVYEENVYKDMLGTTQGRGDMQHKAKHRQQQNSAGMLGQGDRKSLNILPEYQRKNSNKLDNKIDSAKTNGSKIIKVKQGSPEAAFYAKKYRIGNPVGKKTVGGNAYDAGITIIFEEVDQKLVTLYHGTSFGTAVNLIKFGWKPNSGQHGSQMGNPNLFYLTNFIENAQWFADEKDSPTILKITIPISNLIVDPEDGIAETVNDELHNSKESGLPAYLATNNPIFPKQIEIIK